MHFGSVSDLVGIVRGKKKKKFFVIVVLFSESLESIYSISAESDTDPISREPVLNRYAFRVGGDSAAEQT